MLRVERIPATENLFSNVDEVWIYRDDNPIAVKSGESMKMLPVRHSKDLQVYLNKKREWKVRCAMYAGDKRAEELYQKYTSEFEGHTYMNYYDNFALA